MCTTNALPAAVTGRGHMNSSLSNLTVAESPESAPLYMSRNARFKEVETNMSFPISIDACQFRSVGRLIIAFTATSAPESLMAVPFASVYCV